jgi:hypothetical protein
VNEHRNPDTRLRDDTDVVRNIARDLAEVASRISSFKGEAYAYLSDRNYNTLWLQLENAHASVEAAAVEARRRVRMKEGRQR